MSNFLPRYSIRTTPPVFEPPPPVTTYVCEICLEGTVFHNTEAEAIRHQAERHFSFDRADVKEVAGKKWFKLDNDINFKVWLTWLGDRYEAVVTPEVRTQFRYAVYAWYTYEVETRYHQVQADCMYNKLKYIKVTSIDEFKLAAAIDLVNITNTAKDLDQQFPDSTKVAEVLNKPRATRK